MARGVAASAVATMLALSLALTLATATEGRRRYSRKSGVVEAQRRGIQPPRPVDLSQHPYALNGDPLPKHLTENEITPFTHPPDYISMETIHHMTDKELIDYAGGVDLGRFPPDNRLRFLEWAAYDARERRHRRLREIHQSNLDNHDPVDSGDEFHPSDPRYVAKHTGGGPTDKELEANLPDDPQPDGRRHPALEHEDELKRPTPDEHEEMIRTRVHGNLPKKHKEIHETSRHLRRQHGEHIRTKHDHRTKSASIVVPPDPSHRERAKLEQKLRKTGAQAEIEPEETQEEAKALHPKTWISTRERKPIVEKLGEEEIARRRQRYAEMNHVQQTQDFHRGDPSRCFAKAATHCAGLLYNFGSFLSCVVAKEDELFTGADGHCKADFVSLYRPCLEDINKHCKEMTSAQVSDCLLKHTYDDVGIWTRAKEAAAKADGEPIPSTHLDGIMLSETCRSSDLVANMLHSSDELRHKYQNEDLPDEIKDTIHSHQVSHLEKHGGHEDEDPDFQWADEDL